MKKFLFITITFFLTSAFCFGQNAVIKNMTGTVELKKSGSSDWIPAADGNIVSIIVCSLIALA